MAMVPRSGWRVVLGCALVLAGGTLACGRTDFDTGASTAASGTGGAPSLVSQLPPTPGLFVCGDGLCNTTTQRCCLGLSTSGSVTAGCQPLTSSCSGVALQCDEPADCGAATNVCCVGLGATTAASLLSSLGTSCVAASRCSGTGQLVVCRQDSDCHGAGVCCAGSGVPTCLAACPKI